jgi:serine/threonine-protein kinase
MGTVAYMSPEQILGREANARSDLFALGIVLYEKVAGRHPFRKSAVETRPAILHDDPPPIAAPAAIKRNLRRRPENATRSAFPRQ